MSWRKRVGGGKKEKEKDKEEEEREIGEERGEYGGGAGEEEGMSCPQYIIRHPLTRPPKPYQPSQPPPALAPPDQTIRTIYSLI